MKPRSRLPWVHKGLSIIIEPSATTQHTIGFFESREDAAYATRAANSLQELLTAARQALTDLRAPPGKSDRPVVEMLRAAIKSAEP